VLVSLLLLLLIPSLQPASPQSFCHQLLLLLEMLA
jgi:hypothetical protein